MTANDEGDKPTTAHSAPIASAFPDSRHKPRVCIVAMDGPATTGGLATYARELANSLADSNDLIYVSRFSRHVPGDVNHGIAETPRDYQYGKLSARIIAPALLYRPFLRQLLHFLCRPWLRSFARRLYVQAYVPQLRRAIPPDVDVVHSIGTGWDMLGFAAAKVARERRARFTVWPAVHPQSWGDGPLDIELYRQADVVFAQSNFEKQHLIDLGVDGGRIKLCPLAPPIHPPGNGAEFRDRHNLGDRPIVLFIGQKSRAKGYLALRSAMKRILEAVPDCCLVAIGPEKESEYPPVPAGALLDLGVAAEEEKAGALAACNVFCMPSSAESFGIVYAEAWSYGKPVIVGPAPAARELVSDGVNGLHSSQSPQNVAAAVIRLLLDPQMAARLGAAGKLFQQAHLTWDAVYRVHLEAFRSACLSAGACEDSSSGISTERDG